MEKSEEVGKGHGEGPLGYVVLRVRDIDQLCVAAAEAVEGQLRQRIVYDRALKCIPAFTETVEDELAGGGTTKISGSVLISTS